MLGKPLGSAALAAYRAKKRIGAKLFSVAVGGGFGAFGARTVLVPPIRLRGAGRIEIGSDVFVGADSWLQTIPEDGEGIALSIGDGTSIAGHCVLSAVRSVRIGAKVLLARNVYISDHTHGYTDTAFAVLDQPLERIEPVEIADGAWLGQNVVVCPGVRVGRGAVVGANSVVVDDVPDYAVAVGAPARVVKEFASPAAPSNLDVGAGAP